MLSIYQNGQMASNLDFRTLGPSGTGLMATTATQLAQLSPGISQEPLSAFGHSQMSTGAHPQINMQANSLHYGVALGQAAHPHSHTMASMHAGMSTQSQHTHTAGPVMQVQALYGLPTVQGGSAGGIDVGLDTERHMHMHMAPSFMASSFL